MALDPFLIPGIAPDKAYRGASGALYRARVAQRPIHEVRAAPNIDPALIAPMRIHLSISIAVIDEEGYVQRLNGGGLRIADEPIWIIVNGGAAADLPAMIEEKIEELIDKAESALVGMPDAAAYLSNAWGIDLTPPPAATPTFNIPVTLREMTAADIFLPDEANSQNDTNAGPAGE